MGGLDATEHHIGIGDGQWAAAAVTGRSGGRARGIGSDAVAAAIEVQDRTTTGRDGMDIEHRRAQPDTGDLRDEHPLVLTREMRYVRGGSTHIEADDPVVSGEFGHSHHADDAARRTGQDGVLTAELSGLGEAAIGLHEHQPHTGELVGDLLDVAAQHRREIGVHHRGIPARHQFHQRAHLAGQRDLRKSDLTGDAADRLFMFRIQMRMHADNGDSANTAVVQRFQFCRERIEIWCGQHGTVRRDALVHLDHTLVQ